jgi:hypothetical protein
MADHDHLHLHTPHEHDHVHPHTHGHIDDPAKIEALLTYMADHNKQHGEEISALAHSLSHAGQSEAAGLLDAGVQDFEKGNEKLAKALDLLRGGHQ